MSLVDVTEVLSDPDFVQPITVVRRIPCVDAYGQNQLQEQPTCTVGSVQPVSGKTLSRLPEALRVANVQSFWVKQSIVLDNRWTYPDLLVKNGIKFAVQMVFNWSDWGAGWSEGVCVMEKPS